MLTLDIAICTYRPEGIRRVAAEVLPPAAGIRYIISWQAHQGAPIPDALLRDDIEVHRFDRPGLSWNRNNAFNRCSGDIILISDDDLVYNPEGLRGLISSFECNPDVDVATFRSIHKGAGIAHPAVETDLNNDWPRNYSATSFEIALRRATAGALRCHPLFGLGSDRFHGGEDELLVLTAIRRGLRCRYFPITICEHDHLSTGCKQHFSNANLRAFGAVIALTTPATAPLRVPLKAWRVWRAGQASLPRALAYITSGAVMAPFVRRATRRYLW